MFNSEGKNVYSEELCVREGAEVIKWRSFDCLFELDFVFPFSFLEL